MIKFQVTVSDEAFQNLTEHFLFLATVNEKAAEKLKVQLISSIKSLETLPLRFRRLFENEPNSPYRIMVVQKHYGVIYSVREQNVFVSKILDLRGEYDFLCEK